MAAIEAATLVAQIREAELDCNKCSIWKRKLAGDLGFYKRNCTPEGCQLNRYQKLGDLELWERFLDYTNAIEHGFTGLVETQLAARSWLQIKAFIEFKTTLDRLEMPRKLAAHKKAQEAARKGL